MVLSLLDTLLQDGQLLLLGLLELLDLFFLLLVDSFELLFKDDDLASKI